MDPALLFRPGCLNAEASLVNATLHQDTTKLVEILKVGEDSTIKRISLASAPETIHSHLPRVMSTIKQKDIIGLRTVLEQHVGEAGVKKIENGHAGISIVLK